AMSDRLSECFETYLKGYKDHRTIDGYKHTEITGRMLAYKSRIFRSATMGDEYPTTFFDGELKTQTDIELPICTQHLATHLPYCAKKGAITFLFQRPRYLQSIHTRQDK